MGLFFFSSCVFSTAQDRIVDHQRVTINADDLHLIEFNVEAGDLEILGEPGRYQIEIELEYVARGNASEGIEKLIDGLSFDHWKEGNTLYVRSETRQRSWNRNGKINLTAYVPETVSIRVDDSSGWIKIRSINGDCDIDDSSGDLMVFMVDGSLKIDDSSGDIEISDVSGRVEIDDSSGDIDASSIHDIELSDSSGDIDVSGSNGNVTVISDSSGDIDVRDVAGNFEVRNDGSGRIRYTDVRGTVSIPEDKRRD
jgi:hypothetical protein